MLLWKISISLALVTLFGFWRPHRHTEWTQSDIWRFLTREGVEWRGEEGGVYLVTGLRTVLLYKHFTRPLRASVCTAW